MGSFNVKCGITKLEIQEGRDERVWLIPIISFADDKVNVTNNDKELVVDSDYNWHILSNLSTSYNVYYGEQDNETLFCIPATYFDYGLFDVDLDSEEFLTFARFFFRNENLCLTAQGENEYHDFAFDPKDFDELLRVEVDLSQRKELWHNFQHIIREHRIFFNVPYYFRGIDQKTANVDFMVVKHSVIEAYIKGKKYLAEHTKWKWDKMRASKFVEQLQDLSESGIALECVISMLSQYRIEPEPIQFGGQEQETSFEYANLVKHIAMQDLSEYAKSDEEFYEETYHSITTKLENMYV